MAELYIAGENIPAGHCVTAPAPNSQTVYGLDPLKSQVTAGLKIVIGIARENLREGFRVQCADNGDVREDDA